MGDLFDDQLANFHEPLPELSSLKTAKELLTVFIGIIIGKSYQNKSF